MAKNTTHNIKPLAYRKKLNCHGIIKLRLKTTLILSIQNLEITSKETYHLIKILKCIN